MPLVGFLCPDKQGTLMDDCLDECRLCDELEAGRCMPPRTLRLIAAGSREWTGKPSVTQLLNGSRQSFLEIKKDYFVDPFERASAVLGTVGHSILESHIRAEELAEQQFELDGITGRIDYYTPTNGGTLYDTKIYGSWKCMQLMGLKEEWHEVQGPVAVQRTARNVGKVQPVPTASGKPKKEKKIVKGEPDIWYETMQLNMYRLMLEGAGYPCANMFIDLHVRDGKVQLAFGRGIEKPYYLLPVKRLPDAEVLGYFQRKRDVLLRALEYNRTPPACTDQECWSGRKCKGYCAVAQYCNR